MRKDIWLPLQLFAGEGSGGDGGGEGAATGVDTADAGQKRLLELGVPADKIRKNRAYRAPAAEPARQEAAQEAQEQAAAAETGEDPETAPAAEAPRLTWEQIMADPEYNKQMQQTMQARLRTAKAAEENLGKLTPALELLARQYGQDPSKIDYDALAQAISNDDAHYEQQALEMGTDVGTAKKLDQQQRDTARQQRQEAQNLEQQRIQQHFQRLEQQGQELKKIFPQFDLATELRNPAFARMTAPGTGIMSVEDAYRAVHRAEIEAAAMQVTAQKTAQKLSNAIQAGQKRPAEAGTSGQAPTVTTFDYRTASREQREALKQRIRNEAAHGRKVYPGQ
jgi:hypothetical protein